MQRNLAKLALAEERLVVISTLDRQNSVLGKRFFSGQENRGQGWAEIGRRGGGASYEAYPNNRSWQVDHHFPLFGCDGCKKDIDPTALFDAIQVARGRAKPGVCQVSAAIGGDVIDCGHAFVIDQDATKHAVVIPVDQPPFIFGKRDDYRRVTRGFLGEGNASPACLG